MTWVIDDTHGRRWVETPPRKRRASPKGRRFAEIKVGDWLEGGPWSGLDHNGRKYARQFYLVTDHWFDPVAGEEDAEKGMLFAVARLKGLDRATGEPRFERKATHTRFGLASQRYQYSTVADPLGVLRATFEAVQSGEVVSIGRGKRRSDHAR